jgi:hypothetical protein
MNKKLNDEEYHAFFQMFDGTSVQIRRLSAQGKIFRFSFYFVNIYAPSFIIMISLATGFFLDGVDKEIFTEEYTSVLSARAYVYLWLLAGLNIAYYFIFYFRFFVVLIIMYLANSTIDQAVLFYSIYNFDKIAVLFISFFTQPFAILAALLMIFRYDEQK